MPNSSKPTARVARMTFAVLLLGCVLLFERPAQAYIDPGSGSLIYQALLAGLLGLGFTFRRTKDAITHFVRTRFGRGGSHDGAGPDRA